MYEHLNSKLSNTTQYLKESEEQLEQKLEAGKELEKEVGNAA